ncbi:MAG: hypothetical protein WBA07_32600 [Rivularia sp. (in: cyanobacteria)]
MTLPFSVAVAIILLFGLKAIAHNSSGSDMVTKGRFSTKSVVELYRYELTVLSKLPAMRY